jgi:hypothetical protein
MRCIQGRALPAEESAALRPQESGITRVEDYRAHTVIWANERATTESLFVLYYIEDPKVNLPNWLVAKVAATTIPSSLVGILPAAKNYPRLRMHKMLQRFGRISEDLAPQLHDSSEVPGASAVHDDTDQDSFYSASDHEESDAENDVSLFGQAPLSLAPQADRRRMSKWLVSAASSGASVVASAAAATARGAAAAVVSSKGRHNEALVKQHQKEAEQFSDVPRPHALEMLSATRTPASSSTGKSTQRTREASTPRRSKFKGTSTSPTIDKKSLDVRIDSSKDSDVEKGLLVLSREERDLLLEVLSETRERRTGVSPGWWLCHFCRRRLCGSRSARHKL